MKDSYVGKVAYFTHEKEFDSGYGDTTEIFSDAMVYDGDTTDEKIREQFDKDFQEHLEIWNVLVTIETI